MNAFLDDACRDGGATWLVRDIHEAEQAVVQLCERDCTRWQASLPDQPWDLSGQRLVLVAAIRGSADVAGTVLAAARGVTLVLAVDGAGADPLEVDALLDALARLRPVRTWGRNGHGVEPAPDPSRHDCAELGEEYRRLLDLLADGASLGEAAATSHLSLRTANRRLSEARSALGAPSNRAAVLAWRARQRHG